MLSVSADPFCFYLASLTLRLMIFTRISAPKVNAYRHSAVAHGTSPFDSEQECRDTTAIKPPMEINKSRFVNSRSS